MSYEVLTPSLPFIGGYMLTYTLYKFKIIKKVLHINIWNFIIGLAFLIAGGAGLLLLIFLDLGMVTPINHALMYWHVEVGISLTLITVFHIHCYWRSAKKTFIPAKRRVKS
jgi:uncharacterized membrane protein